MVIELGPLDHTSSEHLLTELSLDELGPQERRVLVGRADGNPLFLVELARAAHATGSTETLPDALEPLLAARVDRLSPADRRALRAAAVLGSRFEKELLARVVEDDVELDDGLWAAPIGVRARGGGRAGLRARAGPRSRVRRAFLPAATVAARPGCGGHRRTLPKGPISLSSCSRCTGWPPNAGTEPGSAPAWPASEPPLFTPTPTRPRSSVGRSTLPLTSREVPEADLARVGELLGDVCELAGNYERARAAYGDAHRRLHHGAGRARLLRKVGVLQERRGRYPQALRNYTSALRHLDGDGDADLVERCELKLASAGVRHRQGRLRESAAEATVAGEDAERAGYRHGLAHALYLRHINSVYLDEPDDALADEALAIFVELGDLVGQGNVLNNLGISAHYRGAWPEALEHYRASRAARERTGDLVGAATEDNNIGEILSDQGHYAEAERCFNAAKSTWRAARYPIGEALAASNLGRLAARTGRTLRGAALLAEARAAFEAIHAGSYVDETDVRLTECTLLAGELHRAAAAGAELTNRFPRPARPRAPLRRGPPPSGRRPGRTRRHRGGRGPPGRERHPACGRSPRASNWPRRWRLGLS